MPRHLRVAAVVAAAMVLLCASVFDAASVPAPAPGPVRLAVIMFRLPTSPAFAVSRDSVAQTYFGPTRSVATLYSAASRGALSVTGAVFGPYQIQGSDQSCDLGSWSAAATSAATAAGVDLSGFTNTAFLFPRVNACPWGGLADVGGTESYINDPAPGDVGLYHAAHELGHDLGAGHAHGLRCLVNGVPVAISNLANCQITQYADPFSLMGSGIVAAPSAWERAQMGLLRSDEVYTVSNTALGDYSLAPLGTSNAARRLLLIRRPSGGYIAVEYRRSAEPFSPLAGTGVSAAIFVRLIVDPTDVDSVLVDSHPQTWSLDDAYLQLGERLVSWPDNVSISVRSVGDGSATVTVATAQTSTVTTPTPTPTPVRTATPTSTPLPSGSTPPAPSNVHASVQGNGTVYLSWTRPTNAPVGMRFRVTRAGAVVAVVDGSTYLDAQRLTANTTYGLTSIDSSGRASSTAYVTARPPDQVAPSAVPSLSVRMTWTRTVIATWGPATDNVGVTRYLVTIAGGRTVSTSAQTVSLAGLRSGLLTLTVRAVDAAGNMGAGRSVTFRV